MTGCENTNITSQLNNFFVHLKDVKKSSENTIQAYRRDLDKFIDPEREKEILVIASDGSWNGFLRVIKEKVADSMTKYEKEKAIHDYIVANTAYGVPVEDRSTLYIILTVLGFGIVAYVMAQSDLNKFANNATA